MNQVPVHEKARRDNYGYQAKVNIIDLKGIFQPFELGGETILIRSAVER
jgi:hypothetical protein